MLYPLSYEGIVPICRSFTSASARRWYHKLLIRLLKLQGTGWTPGAHLPTRAVSAASSTPRDTVPPAAGRILTRGDKLAADLRGQGRLRVTYSLDGQHRIVPGDGGQQHVSLFGVCSHDLLRSRLLSAIAAPLALAASWSISDPVGQDIGYVTKLSDTKYAVTKNSGTRVGTVLKTSRGWKVRRDGKYLATLKKNGPRAHPVNMYSGNGARIGRCGPTSDGDQLSLDRCASPRSYAASDSHRRTVQNAPRSGQHVCCCGSRTGDARSPYFLSDRRRRTAEGVC